MDKFKFSAHISYTAERSRKLIHSLSKSAKLTWGLNHKALQTNYKKAIYNISFMALRFGPRP